MAGLALMSMLTLMFACVKMGTSEQCVVTVRKLHHGLMGPSFIFNRGVTYLILKGMVDLRNNITPSTYFRFPKIQHSLLHSTNRGEAHRIL